MNLLTHPVVPAVAGVALATLIVFQIVSAIRLANRLRAAAEMAGRLDRLTAAIGLLTDTTEGGLGALTSEIERLGRRAVVTTPRDAKRMSTNGARRDEFSLAALDAALAAGESTVHLGGFQALANGDQNARLLA
jgi:hypothetical protein